MPCETGAAPAVTESATMRQEQQRAARLGESQQRIDGPAKVHGRRGSQSAARVAGRLFGPQRRIGPVRLGERGGDGSRALLDARPAPQPDRTSFDHRRLGGRTADRLRTEAFRRRRPARIGGAARDRQRALYAARHDRLGAARDVDRARQGRARRYGSAAGRPVRRFLHDDQLRQRAGARLRRVAGGRGTNGRRDRVRAARRRRPRVRATAVSDEGTP